MKNVILATSLVLSLLPLAAAAAPTHHASKAPATTYQCRKCHMKVSAATAKKDGYKDPMDGGKLVPMTAAKPMSGMKM